MGIVVFVSELILKVSLPDQKKFPSVILMTLLLQSS